MSRALFGALQAALAGVSGGAQGYAQYQEMERKRAQEEAERERRRALDIVSLQERGYTTPEQYAKQREEATRRGGQVASQALMSALSPMTAVPPVAEVTDADVSALSRALALSGEPAQRVMLGDQEFVRGETPEQRQERLDLLALGRQRIANREAREARLADQEAEESARLRRTVEESELEQRSAYNELKALGVKIGEYQEGRRYDTRLKDYYDRRSTGTRTPSRSETIQAFVDKQVADEIARMGREGKPPAYFGAPRQRYTREELAEEAAALRGALLSTFEPAAAVETPTPSARSTPAATPAPAARPTPTTTPAAASTPPRVPRAQAAEAPEDYLARTVPEASAEAPTSPRPPAALPMTTREMLDTLSGRPATSTRARDAAAPPSGRSVPSSQEPFARPVGMMSSSPAMRDVLRSLPAVDASAPVPGNPLLSLQGIGEASEENLRRRRSAVIEAIMRATDEPTSRRLRDILEEIDSRLR